MCWSWSSFFQLNNIVHAQKHDAPSIIRSEEIGRNPPNQGSSDKNTSFKTASITCPLPALESHNCTMAYHSTVEYGNSIPSTSHLMPIKSRRRTTSDQDASHIFSLLENPPSLPTQPRRVTILLVDDAPINQTIGTKMLHKLGVCVRIAHDGEDAVRQICENYRLDSTQPSIESNTPNLWHPALLRSMSTPAPKFSMRHTANQEPIDLVLMDCHMPIKDGIAATREIRELESSPAWRYGHLPIIACSTDCSESCKSGFTDAGADDFLHKPYRFESLKEMLEKHLSGGNSSSREVHELKKWEWN